MSLIEETAMSIQATGVKRIGLLASPTTIKSGLYEKPLLAIGCSVILPTTTDIDNLNKLYVT